MVFPPAVKGGFKIHSWTSVIQADVGGNAEILGIEGLGKE